MPRNLLCSPGYPLAIILFLPLAPCGASGFLYNTAPDVRKQVYLWVRVTLISEHSRLFQIYCDVEVSLSLLFMETLLRADFVLSVHTWQLMWSQDTWKSLYHMLYGMEQEMKNQEIAASLRPHKGICLTPKLGFFKNLENQAWFRNNIFPG